ncbi:YhcN/YlaJ family sporulation lipoprotein [Clostridium sp. DL1XJH146]
MKKFNKVLVVLFSAILVFVIATACQNDIEKEEDNILTEENEDKDMEEEDAKNVEDDGMEETEGTDDEKEATEGQEVSTNYETMLLRDQKISDMIKSMDEIKEAEVATYENNTLIAVTLQDDVDELNEQLREKIIEEAKAVDETIENVKITEDENIKEELKTTKESMKSQEMSEDLENKIKELFEGID